MNQPRKTRRPARRSPNLDTRRQLFLESLEGRDLMATLTLVGNAPTYIENASAEQVAPQWTVGDPGTDANFSGGTLTVAIQANAQPNDVLSVISQGTGAGQISVSGTDVSFEGTIFATVATGSNSLTFTFDPDASTSAVQALVRQIGFRNTGDNPTSLARTIRFSLTDGDSTTAPDVDGTVNVTAVNDAPVAQSTSVTTLEDTAHTFAASEFLFTDAENDALVSITISNLSLAGGTLKLNNVDVANGDTITLAQIPTLVYLPASNQNGTAVASFGFTVNDAAAGTTVGTMALNVTAVNDVPVAGASSITTLEDTAHTFAASEFNFTDVENNALVSITISNLNLVGGTLKLNNVNVSNGDTITLAQIPTLVYLPASNQNGTGVASFGFTVNDAGSGTTIGTMTLNVTAVNDVPVATVSTVTTNEDVSHTFILADFPFTDIESNSLVSIRITNLNLGNGTLKLNGSDVTSGDTITAAQIPNLVYAPAANESGNALATFNFTVNDAGTGTVPALLTINVTAVNDNPVLVLSTESANFVPSGTPVVIAGTSTVTDIDSANFDTGTLTVALTTNGTASDTIAIRNQGTAANQIGVSGSNVTFGGTTIGTFTGGGGTTALVITFNSSATVAAVQALTRNIIFSNSDISPSLLTRTVQFTLLDGDGGNDIDTKQVTVGAVNLAPVLTLSTEAVTHTEGGSASVIAATTTLTDPDSANFNGGNVTVTTSANSTVADRLEIINQGTAANQIGVSGSNVTFGGTTIGTFTGGAGSTPLVVTLNASATPAAVQALLRNITFRVASDTPSTLARTITFSVTDSAGANAATDTKTKTVNVAATNDPPNIDLSTETVTYTAGGAAVVVSSTGVVTDLDSTDFSGGTLTVTITANGVSTDSITIRNQGTASGQIGVSGSNVTFGGTTIGTFTGGTGTTPLVITFNASSTPAAAEALSRNILFSNTAASPSTAARTLSFALTDGDGGTDTATKSVAVATTNAAPVLTLSTEAVTYTENGTAIVITTGATVTDSDSPNFNGGNVTVSVSANSTADDRLEVRNQGSASGQIGVSGSNITFGGTTIGTFTGGSGSTPLVITLNSSATVAAVQALVQNITFRTITETPSTTARTITFSVTDSSGASAQTATQTKALSVAAVNDPPVFTPSTEATNYAAGGAAVVVSTTGTVTDVDSADFNTGTLIVAVTTGGNSTDLISILPQGSGNTAITVSSGTISFGGTAVATFTGGTGTTPLTITFNASATVAAVQAVSRAIGYSNTAAQPGVGTRTLSFTLSDGDGGTDTVRTKSVNVTGVSANPVITLSTENATYAENAATAAIIAATTTITDSDSTDFNAGTLTVTLTTNGISTDRLTVVTQGTASGQIGVNGSNITFGGTTIGTFTGGTGTTPLVITLNSSATTAAVQALIRRIGFSNTGDAPGTSARTVSFVLTDGDGGTSTTVTKNVAVTDVNDAPVNTVPGQQSSLNGADVVFSTGNNNAISISDPDAGTGVVKVTLAVTKGTLTLSGVTGLTFSAGDGTGDATMTFTGTIAAINTALQGLKFVQAANNTTDVTLTITTSDEGLSGSGGTKTDADTIVIRRTSGTGTSSYFGSVFVDSNNNGTKDTNEVGIRGVTITLNGLGTNAGLIRTTTTNANGVFSFEDLPAGNYRITQSQPATFTDGKTTGPTGATISGNSVTATIAAGQTIRSVAFGEKGLAPTQISIQSFLSSTDHTAIIQSVAQGSSNGQSLRLSPANAPRTSAPATQASLSAARQAVRQAAKQWESATNSAGLAQVKVRIADLEGDQLAVTKDGVITFDIDAAGQGWFIDPTPGKDEEFAAIGGELVARSAAAKDRVDLLTVAAHELGHVLGHDDLYSDSDAMELMAAQLVAGIRKKS